MTPRRDLPAWVLFGMGVLGLALEWQHERRWDPQHAIVSIALIAFGTLLLDGKRARRTLSVLVELLFPDRRPPAS